MEAADAAARVQRFAENSCRGESPLYENLCAQMAADHRLIEIVRATPAGQPAPNLLLAAVHFLLLSGVRHELARYYLSCAREPLPRDGAFAAFRDFCLEHEQPVRRLMAARRVQTNEVRRCAYLFPAFSFVSRQLHGRPLALIEIGSSAGLLLNWDRYAYDFGTGRRYGDAGARVLVESEWRGGQPPLTDGFPTVADRVGIDLHVVDVNKPEEAMWLRSLVWPDQPDRLKLITDAIDEFQAHPVRLVEGDAFDRLPAAIDTAPVDAAACVFHCHTLNQFSAEQRQQFQQLLQECSQRRPLVQLSAEWIDTPQPELRLVHWDRGQAGEMLLAAIDHHGRWVEWRTQP